METKFNSQICTSREQSKALLALGLKKETADCGHFYGRDEYEEGYYWDTIILNGGWQPYWDVTDNDIPAWSLHRLIEMMPLLLRKGDVYSLIYDIHRDWVAYMTYASGERNPYNRYLWESQNTNTYDAFIDCIEWLIKEGYFNKEYLV